MVMQKISIDSNFKISNIEQHFRVSAGPGAGKTHWLIEHIKNVLGNSTRLGKTRNIACLTYSNVGVDTIKKRLGTSAQQVEVSTLHSFLYRHIVKPYAWSIAGQYNLNVKLMDGHDDEFVSKSKVNTWLESHPNKNRLISPYSLNQLKRLPDNQIKLQNWLLSLNYNLDNSNNLIIVSNRRKATKGGNKYPLNKNCLNLLETSFLSYKELYWKEGFLSHNDVLFFSYQVIKLNPFVLNILRAKFPYFLIDEFQDTNPIQVEILKQLAQKETIIGIIGDKAQSIYGFQGADAKQFTDFSLSNLQDYVMEDNRRSTNEIIDLLNHVRTDIRQNKYRNETGRKPILYVGERKKALEEIKKIIGIEDLTILAFKNTTVKAIEMQQTGKSENLFKKLKNEDTNSTRVKLIETSIKATKLAKKGKFKEAIHEFLRLQRRAELKKRKKVGNTNPIKDSLKLEWKKNALTNISILISKYKDISVMTITDFSNNFLNTAIQKISKISKAKDVHKKTFNEFANCVDIKDEVGNFRTIHKAKGDEFNNVLVVLEDKKGLNFIKTPDLTKEGYRVGYVAISRAKQKLFLYVPDCDCFSNNLIDKIIV